MAVICGAGLSMSPPTQLFSARALAERCADRYTQVTRTQLSDEIRSDLGRLVDYFLGLNRFRDLLNFVPWEYFFQNPNGGHVAIADFLCCGALTLAATTNYDTHIEDAAMQLGERDFQSVLDGVEAGELTDRHRPLLKLHGCCRRDRKNTLWAGSQISTNDVIKERLDNSGDWLKVHLTGKDLLVVGFWTDWAYLNDVLSKALAGSEPRTVVLVDPDAPEVLREKAPKLWDWANQQKTNFFHVPESADAFLDELRVVFSRGFIEQALEGSIDLFAVQFPERKVGEVEVPNSLSSDDLYLLRKDLCGCSGARPSRARKPDQNMNLVGAFFLAVMAAGGTIGGSCFSLQDRCVRVINCSHQLLSHVKVDFADELSASRDCDTVVCVGAVDDGVPSDLVRGGELRTIVRQGWEGEWMTDDSARERLGL